MTSIDWQKHLRDQPHSGLSIPKYCLREGIHSTDFYKKRKELRSKQPDEDFASIAIKPGETCPYLDVRIEVSGDRILFRGSSNHRGFLSGILSGLKS